MRRVRAISPDGYAEGSGGDLGVMPLDEAFDIHHAHLIAGADRLVHGDDLPGDVSRWPQVPSDPDASDAEREIAQRCADGIPVIFGSRTLFTHLLREGLVDQLPMMVGPKLVAGDRPVFDAVPMTELRLRDVTRFPDSENVVLDYDVLPPSSE